jgi:hypothetical protein
MYESSRYQTIDTRKRCIGAATVGTLALLCVIVQVPSVRAGPVTTFTDLEAFLAAAGDVQEIDFETLPDGTPSVANTLITPEFNYTDQGVTFSSPFPVLRIGNPHRGLFDLEVFHQDSNARNWIIADFVTPAFAVGIVFPGGTTLSAFDADEQLIVSVSGSHSGAGWFLGVVSDVPIASITQDRGSSYDIMQSFLFTPVPEPGTLLLFAVGLGALMRRRRFSSAA